MWFWIVIGSIFGFGYYNVIDDVGTIHEYLISDEAGALMSGSLGNIAAALPLLALGGGGGSSDVGSGNTSDTGGEGGTNPNHPNNPPSTVKWVYPPNPQPPTWGDFNLKHVLGSLSKIQTGDYTERELWYWDI